MKISKLSVIIFIFLLGISLAPSTFVSSTDVSNQTNNGGVTTTQAVPSTFGSEFINASIMDITRNITVVTNGLVSLEDEFKLDILDDDTQIATLNYSIPTEFALYAEEVTFFSQYGDNIGITSANNSKSYSVFYGDEVTTYSIDITEDGFPANSSSEGVFMYTELNAMDIITAEADGINQRSVFSSPIVPMFQNFDTELAKITIALQGSQDAFVRSEIKRLRNAFGTEMPRFTDVENIITYEDMSRDAFDYRYGLEEGDLEVMTFDGVTPLSLDEQSGILTAFVPSRVSNADRVVRFDPWGTVFVKEDITVTHLGAPFNTTQESYFSIFQVSSHLFTISDKARLTDVYDAFGSLTQRRDNNDDGYPDTSVSTTDGKQDFSINFRNAIYGGESYTFTVEYQYNASSIIAEDTDTGILTMNTTLFSDLNVTTSNLNVVYEFPLGTTFVGHSYQSHSRMMNYQIYSSSDRNPLSAFDHFELIFSATNVSYVDITDFQIYFEYNGLGHYQYAATYLYVTLILLAAVYVFSNITYKPSKAVEIEKALIPINEMDAFFNYFSEKTGAEKRIAELRSRRQKGKLSKKDYDGQVSAIRKRLRDINPQLEKASQNLSKHGGRYENYVKRVMLASQRQIDIRRNAREAKLSYEKGNIPKDIYQLRIREFNESLKKEETTINKTLTEMVEVIQKYNQ